jgi:acyl dehydratase
VSHFASVDDLIAAVGRPAETSEWILIDQKRIDTFADATGDHQWIHVDLERAASGPYGVTIAHGYLTLSLLSGLLFGLMSFDGNPTVINYGLDRVRFLSPVPVDSRVRVHVEIADVTPTPQGARLTQSVTFEIEGVEKPAAVAVALSLIVFGGSPVVG